VKRRRVVVQGIEVRPKPVTKLVTDLYSDDFSRLFYAKFYSSTKNDRINIATVFRYTELVTLLY